MPTKTLSKTKIGRGIITARKESIAGGSDCIGFLESLTAVLSPPSSHHPWLSVKKIPLKGNLLTIYFDKYSILQHFTNAQFLQALDMRLYPLERFYRTLGIAARCESEGGILIKPSTVTPKIPIAYAPSYD